MTEARRSISPKVLARGIGQFLLGVALFAGLIYWVAPSWDAIEGTVELHLPWLGVSLAGSLLATIVTAARWKLLSETMGTSRLPYGVYFHYLALTRVIGQVLPTVLVDLFGRTAALKAAGSDSKLGQLIAPVILERLLDLLLPLTLLAWAIAIHTGAPAWLDPWLSLAVLVALFVSLAIPLLGPLVRLALRVYGALRKLRGKSTDTAEAMPAVPLPLSGRVVTYSVLRYVGILIQYFGAGAGLGVTLDALVLVSAAPLAQLAGLVGITPGGLGVQEGGWVASLARLGVDEASIVVFMAGTRLMMSVNFGILSACSWPWRRPGRSGRPASSDP